jgi:hypothetical protein
MLNTYEVTFSIVNTNPDGTDYMSSDSSYITTRVQCVMPQQAEAMIKGQYGPKTWVHSCYPVH